MPKCASKATFATLARSVESPWEHQQTLHGRLAPAKHSPAHTARLAQPAPKVKHPSVASARASRPWSSSTRPLSVTTPVAKCGGACAPVFGRGARWPEWELPHMRAWDHSLLVGHELPWWVTNSRPPGHSRSRSESPPRLRAVGGGGGGGGGMCSGRTVTSEFSAVASSNQRAWLEAKRRADFGWDG